MIDESPLGHLHCPRCGREVRPGRSCPVCGPIGYSEAQRLEASTLPTAPIPDATTALARSPRGDRTTVVSPRHASALVGRPRRSAHRGPSIPRVEGRLPGDPRGVARSTALRLPPPMMEEPAPPRVVLPEVEPLAAAPTRPRVNAPAPPRARRPFRPIDIWKRYLPPVRLVWVFLGVILAFVGGFRSSAIAGPLLLVPIVGAITDLAFQRVRFPRLRFPDAALATSLFLSLIIWPTAVDLALISIAVVAVGVRHVVRVSSHPLLNPAAAGIAIATMLFAMPTSWHLGLSVADSVVIALLGALLIVRATHTWRMPVLYFATYLPATVALTLAYGGSAHLVPLLEAGALGPASIFFGMFMVTEPRTAPTARRPMAIFAGLVGISAAVLPIAFTEVPSLGALGVLAPFLALFIGNVFAAVLPSARGTRKPAPKAVPRASARVLREAQPEP